MAKDTYFPNVALLMHLDGADGARQFVDLTGKTVTFTGNPQISTEQSKFGGASAKFTGVNGEHLSVGAPADFVFLTSLTQDYTFETWVNLTDDSNYRCVVQYGTNTSDDSPSFTIYVEPSSRFPWVVVQSLNAYGKMSVKSSAALPLNAFVHLAVAYVASTETLRFFVDGVLVGSVQKPASFSPGAVATTLKVGGYEYPYFTWAGYLDDLRITRGCARYVADFTPPTEPFPNGGYEVAGTILDANSGPVARKVRAYNRASGALLGEALSSAQNGHYSIAIAADTEVQVVMLDDDAGTLENDQILRTVPV